MLSSVNNKIIVVGPDINGRGGIASVIQTFLNTKNNPFEIELINTYCTSAGKRNLFNFIFALTTLLGRIIFYKPTLVYIHSASKGSFFRKSIIVILCKIFRCKVVFHLHGGGFKEFFNGSHTIIRKYINYIFTSVDLTIVLSDYWKSWLQENMKVPVDVIVLKNGVKPSTCNAKKVSKKQFVFAGRLVEGKGLEDLFEAVKILKGEGEVFQVLIAGEGYKTKYTELAELLDIKDYILFKGWVSREQLDIHISESISLVLPSYAEGMPMCILEAFANKRPVISTYVGSIPEVIEQDVDGFLLEAGDVNKLYLYMKLYIHNTNVADAHGLNGYDKFERFYSESVFINNTFNIINDLILNKSK